MRDRELGTTKRGKVAPPMPLDEAERVRVAIDHWEKPSEMMDAMAWVVGFFVSGAAVTEGEHVLLTESALVHWPESARQVRRLRTPEERMKWFMEATERDRLRSWKVAVEAALRNERLLAAVFDDRTARRACQRAQRELGTWRNVDAMPASVAEEIAVGMWRHARAAARKAAVERLAPSLLRRLAASERAREGERDLWLRALARTEPVLAMKIGIEASMRTGTLAKEGDARGGRGGGKVVGSAIRYLN